MNFIAIAQSGFDAWAAKPHNKKWFRRVDGTPIPNDVVVCIAQAFSEAKALSAPHPSPSPEQGDDLVQRLTEVYEHDWRISFLAHTSDTAREAATELSTLRARVAELEARATELPAWQKPGHQSRPKSTLAAEQSGETGHAGNATPQAGASEAVAWQWRAIEDGEPRTAWKGPDEGDRAGWEAIANRTPNKYSIEKRPLYDRPTPPDSDAVRALKTLRTVRDMLEVEYHDDGRIACVAHESGGLREMVRVLDATLSNQGSSSNGQ